MPSIVSFPNFLCLLLTGVLVVHMVTRTPIEGGFPEVVDDLEVIYCKLPQSLRVEDSRKCSSAQKLFSLLRNGCSLERRLSQNLAPRNNETELEEEDEERVVTVEVSEELEVEVEPAEEQPEGEMKSSLVDSFIISLLVCSAIVSLLEWHRERSRRDEKIGGVVAASPGGGEAVSDRRISLVDLTVNRHIRRRDSQHAEALRQNSTQGSRPPLIRRSSFPAQIPEVRTRHPPQRQQSIPASTRRMSIDLDDDGSPDRRRVRIIRRH